MSGRPSPEGVAKFLDLWAAMSETTSRIERLSHAISIREHERIAAKENYGAAQKELFDLMSAMDIASCSNYGYENRMSWFLVELHRQQSEAVEKRDKEQA